jgi:dihydrofolate reductase
MVVTRQADYKAEGAFVFETIEKAIQWATDQGEETLYIIGGGEIYRQTMSLADVIYLTRVHHRFEADTFFPEIDHLNWKEEVLRTYQADDRNAHNMTFYKYLRKKK